MNRNHGLIFCVCFLTGLMLAWPGAAAADDEEEIANRGVKKYGLTHNIAEDRKVESVGGLYQPEGLDIYLKRHLDALNGRISGLEASIEGLRQKLDEVSALIRKMERARGNQKKEIKGAQAS